MLPRRGQSSVILRRSRGAPLFGEKPNTGRKAAINNSHSGVGVLAPRLCCLGAVAPKESGRLPRGSFEGPSGYHAPGKIGGAAMTKARIADTATAFSEAASEATKPGFEEVRIHGANDCLTARYFTHRTNQRTDRWKGKHRPSAPVSRPGPSAMDLRVCRFSDGAFGIRKRER